MTIENTTTITSGLENKSTLNADRAGVVMGLIRGDKLLDVPQSAEAFLHVFLRGIAFLGGHDFLDFLFQHVDDEFVDRLVARRVGALLHFFQKFAFDFYLV